jgi:hypothetical protein
LFIIQSESWGDALGLDDTAPLARTAKSLALPRVERCVCVESSFSLRRKVRMRVNVMRLRFRKRAAMLPVA